jgi:hypothetical protein
VPLAANCSVEPATTGVVDPVTLIDTSVGVVFVGVACELELPLPPHPVIARQKSKSDPIKPLIFFISIHRALSNWFK